MMSIASPITGGQHVALEKTIPSKYIIDQYLKSYGINVSDLFRQREKVEVYKCEKSGFRFYGPHDLAGDSAFYESLQQFPWYYMDWKWEHEEVKKLLTPGTSLLEIGCAEGAFIKGIADKEIQSVGLELNVQAAENATKNGLDVRTETIQDHAISHPDTYDVVCSFQVMEHVTDVKGIMEASVKALKPGGRLIISVPNNDSFIKYSPDSILNMPPHHMNLWDEASLARMEKFFDMELLGFRKEPLQPYHYQVVVNNFIERNFSRGIAGKILKKAIKWTRVYKLVGLFKNQIKGHSIIAFYTKKG